MDMAQRGSKLLLPGLLIPEATQRSPHWQKKKRGGTGKGETALEES